jgi:hypothetical protein
MKSVKLIASSENGKIGIILTGNASPFFPSASPPVLILGTHPDVRFLLVALAIEKAVHFVLV